jgi:hypothetical protein
MDRDEMSNLYRGSSIDTSYQVSVHSDSKYIISNINPVRDIGV